VVVDDEGRHVVLLFGKLYLESLAHVRLEVLELEEQRVGCHES
jgi:hypothetical protein